MSKVKNVSLMDIKTHLNDASNKPKVTPYQDLMSIIGGINNVLAQSLPFASSAHNMGVSSDNPLFTLCSTLTNDMSNFKARLDSVITNVHPNIEAHDALFIGSQLLTLQEDIERVMLPIVKDISDIVEG